MIPNVLRQGANYIPKETGDNFRLHANELPWCPVDFNSLDLNCYPDYETQNQLQKSLAEIYQVTPDQIVLTRGSDDGIDLLCRLFLNSKHDALMQFAPTFPMYAFYTRMQQAQLIQCPLDAENNFCLNQDTLNNYWSPQCKIIMFCNPNNPTGTSIDLDLIAATCERYAGQSLIVVDEAYIEFSTQKSASSLIGRYDNLVVLRTLSKAYGLAGLRLGSIIAPAKLIEACKKIIPPYSISSAVLALANNALARKDWFATTLNSIKEERKLLASTLKQFSFIKKIVPSEGNFLLLQIDKELTQELAHYLAYRNIIVRDFLEDTTLCNYLRITVGDSQQNTHLIEALTQFLPGGSGSTRQVAGSSITKAAGRCASISRQTKETAIELKLTLDSDHIGPINTPIAFFNHMLEQVAKHGGFNLQLQAQGDLEVDDHHLIEDTAIVLGQALKQALGDKRGI
ncbi:MAG: histidinol-phosphate transaminase, partial [Legionella sp.]